LEGCPVQLPPGSLRRARSPPGLPETRQRCGTSGRSSLHHLHGQRTADAGDVTPVGPAFIQALVPVQLLDGAGIGRAGIRQLAGELSRHILRLGAALIGVVDVDMPEHTCRVSDPVAVSQSRHVEIVPYLVTPDNQVTVDPQGLIWRWYAEHMSGWQRYLRDLQGPVPDELTDSRL